MGSGKSSMLLSCLNEMDVKSGSINSEGSIAYVPQSAFLLNSTFRENITFGGEFDAEKYAKVVYDCRLFEDLETFRGGDQIEIGERGINLSGG